MEWDDGGSVLCGQAAPAAPGKGRKEEASDTGGQGSDGSRKKKLRRNEDGGSSNSEEEDGKKKCSVCRKKRDAADFQKNGCAYCKQCRRSDERLLKLSVQQGQKQWYLDTKKNDYNTWCKMMRDYDKKCPDQGVRRSRGAYNVFQFKTEMMTEQGTSVLGRRQYMWERQYYEWAATTAGGNLTDGEANSKWKEMRDNPAWKRDTKGPRHSPLRLLVGIADEENEYMNHGTKQSMVAETKGKKKLSQKDVDDWTARLTSNHGQAFAVADGDEGKAVEAVRQRVDRARAACAASSSCGEDDVFGVLSGDMTTVPDVKALGTVQLQPSGSSEDAGTGAEKDEDEEEDVQSTTTPKKAKWFDAARATSHIHRKMMQGITLAETTLDKTLLEMQQETEEMAKAPEDQQRLYKVELDLIKNRAAALAVVKGPESGLAEYLAMLAGTAAPEDRSSQADAIMLKAGPCQNFEKLQTLTAMKDKAQVLLTCSTKEELDEHRAAVQAPLDVLKELIAGCKSAVRDFIGAKKANERMEAKRKKEEEKKKEQAWREPIRIAT